MVQGILLLAVTAFIYVLYMQYKRKNGGQFPGSFLAGRSTEKKQTGGGVKAENTKPRGEKGKGRKEELLAVVTDLAAYAKLNHFFYLFPGTLSLDGEIATLTVILVTKSEVIGINCFGYPGIISPGKTPDQDWKQTFEGVGKRIPNPLLRLQSYLHFLRKVLAEISPEKEIPVRVIGVFTSPGVVLRDPDGQANGLIFTEKNIMPELKKKSTLADGGLDPKQLGKAITAYKPQQEDA